jgi:pentatricopeptide repeat protein
MIIYRLCLIACLTLSLFACQNKPAETRHSDSQLGELQFEASGSPAAQPYFEKAMLLLHSFEYEDARTEFLKAQEIDPDFAMAYWGEAMTYHHSIWQRQEYEKGRAALEKLGPSPAERLAKAPTEIERSFLQAVEILFGEGGKFERDKAYAEFMSKLYNQYPGHHEVAAFYALSLLGSVPVGRDEEVYGQSARIAEGILRENARHPGALHYLIHSYDDPFHAELAKGAADRYAKTAPDAAHALHMPSHIYLALGLWDEVVASNEASYAASVNRMERMGLDHDARSYHAFHWLLYGYLQQGRVEAARRILDEMIGYTAELPSKQARAYLARMLANYAAETGDYTGPYSEVSVDLSGLNISHQAAAHFLQGMKAYRQGQGERLDAIISEMGVARQQAAMSVTNEGVPMCSAAGSYGAPNKLDVDHAHVMELELQALLALLRGNKTSAERYFKQAAELENNTSYAYGPPEIAKPSYELYGDWLLEQERYEEALQRFTQSLNRAPKRLLALEGRLKAARALQRDDLAREIEADLAEIRAKAAAQLL